MRQSFLLGLIACVLGATAAGCAGSSTCSPACGDFLECCDGTCAQLATDRNHCGACGNACLPGQMCQGSRCVAGVDGGAPSMCRATCAADQQCCGTACVDRFVEPETNGRLDTSFQNCGSCGHECDITRSSACSIPGGGTTGIARCACGVNAECAAGLLCVPDGASFRCIDLQTDEDNCGGAGVTCVDDEVCITGLCQCPSEGARCAAGTACCGGTCVSTVDDANNCGACGMVCPNNAPDCAASACTCGESGRACEEPVPGIFGIGADPGESCCPGMGCVENTDEYCACTLCPEDLTCQIVAPIIPMPGDPPPEVCCGDDYTPFLGCTPVLPFDGGVFPSDAGPSDAGPSDAGVPDAGFDSGP